MDRNARPTTATGASLSTTLSGLIAESFGRAAGVLALVLLGLAAVATVWLFMPETKPSSRQNAKNNAPGSPSVDAEGRGKKRISQKGLTRF